MVSYTVNVPNRLRGWALLLGLALALAACGTEASSQESVGAASSRSPVSAFDGEFTSLAGTAVDFGSLEGQDVVLWLWAPW